LDGLSSPFKDYAFDLLTCFQVIEHIQDTRSFLRIIAKLLKHDGAVMLSTPNAALRLYPGMQPWNKFHVREYSAKELEATLKGSFANVCIFGLFAKGPADGIERKRVASARAGAANGGARRDETAHINLKHFVDPFVRKIMRTAVTLPLFEKLSLRHFNNSIGKYSTFYLRDSNVDQALDLTAICTHERRSLDHARELIESQFQRNSVV
jgi:SAM-dependent methyltransferase